MNSLHDELAEALSIEDDHPKRMADRVLAVLQRETKSLGAAIAWEQGHLDVCTGCCCDFARINPYRAGSQSFKQGVTVILPTDPADREAVLDLWREQGIHVSGGQEGGGIANTHTHSHDREGD